MMYEPYKGRRRGTARRRRGCLFALLKLLFVLAVLIALLVGALYLLPVGMFIVEPDVDLGLSADLPTNRLNVLLLGVDKEKDGMQRSDTMIIASIGGDSVKLSSILRDTWVDIPGHGEGRINTAYTLGGPELAMRTVNENFGLNIMHYIVVDFTSIVRFADAIGGVEIDITEAEMEQINLNVKDSARIFKPLGYTCDELKVYGEDTHLNGLQALGYARIRKIDSDFMRASRQRTLMETMLKKIKGNIWNPVMLTRLGVAAFDSVETNLNPVQIISIALKAVGSDGVRSLRLPVNESYEDTQSIIKVNDFEMNKHAFRSFVYD